MERGSDKHGSRLDEELQHETEPLERSGTQSHVEEWRQAEPSADDEPDVTRTPEPGYRGGTPAGIDPDEIETRTDVGRHLDPSIFPSDRAGVLDNAASNNAPDSVLDLLRRLPEGRTFATTQEVWTALGGGTESAEHRP